MSFVMTAGLRLTYTFYLLLFLIRLLRSVNGCFPVILLETSYHFWRTGMPHDLPILLDVLDRTHNQIEIRKKEAR
jgi:hypothetical protein